MIEKVIKTSAERISFFFVFVVLLLFPYIASAQRGTEPARGSVGNNPSGSASTEAAGNPVSTVPEIDTTFSSLSNAFPSILGPDISQTTIVTLLNDIFFILIAIGAILAILRIAMAGVKYMLSESFDTKTGAKKDLSGSVLGLVVMLAAVVVLNVINPTLTNLAIFQDLTETPPPQRVTADESQNTGKEGALTAMEECACSGGVWSKQLNPNGACEERNSLPPYEDLPISVPSYCPNSAETEAFETGGYLPNIDAGGRGGRDASAQDGTADPAGQNDPSNPANRGGPN